MVVASSAEVAAAQIGELEYSPLFWNFGNEPSARLARGLWTWRPPASTTCSSPRRVGELRERHQDGAALPLSPRRARPHDDSLAGPFLPRDDLWAFAATGVEGIKNGFGELPGGFFHLTTPCPYRDELFGGEDPFEFCVRELEETIERLGAERIAATSASRC